MKSIIRLGGIVAMVLLMVACSSDNDPLTPEPDPQKPDCLLLTACSNESLHRMVTEQVAIDQSIDLFDSYIEESVDRIKAADLIFMLVSGDRMDLDNEQDLLKKKWETTLRHVANNIIIIYDATTGRRETLSKTVGVDAGPGYYIKTMGSGGYCKMLAPDELTPQALSESIKLVQGHAALGTSDEGEVQTIRFVNTMRLAYYHFRQFDETEEDMVLYTTYRPETLSDNEINRSITGNFLIEYTVYMVPDAKEKYVQIDLKGGGYTSHMTFFDIGELTARAVNMPITYFTSISASGKADGKLPEVKKILPASDNRNASVQESSGFNIGFSASKDPSLSFGYSWSNTVSYDQSEWETKVSYERDMATNTIKHEWNTTPVYCAYHENGEFYNGHWSIPLGSIIYGRIDHSVTKYWDGNFRNAYIPSGWPVTYSDFQPRQSMLVMTEGDYLSITAEAGVIAQTVLADKMINSYRVYGADRKAKTSCEQDIRFSDYMLK